MSVAAIQALARVSLGGPPPGGAGKGMATLRQGQKPGKIGE